MSFLKENFLLQSDTAIELYENYAKNLPLIDYHSHLPPELVAINENFRTITEIWLAGDHYKWRAMRALGIEEKYITGDASDQDKFRKWAEAVPYTIRNPLFHWTHMELKNPFGITELLSGDNAGKIYEQTSTQLQNPSLSPRGILDHFNVEMVGTTDDPADTLDYHQQISRSGIKTKVLPSFRPDKSFNLHLGDSYREYINKLGSAAGVRITDLDSLLQALQNRVDYFHQHGCRMSDHGLSSMPPVTTSDGLERVFKGVLSGNDSESAQHKDGFTFFVLSALCKMYHDKGWVQQFHLGALRNTNSRKLNELGADTGYDSIGDYQQGENLAGMLNYLENKKILAKTIIYNVNPSHNAVFAAMTGNFQQEGIKGKIQFGSAWWFMDQLDGMKQQIDMLSNIGLISCFIGMLTDSRSFLSYPRHEYFRRLLSNMFANDIKQGLIPNDIKWTGKIISDICYYNAKNYFE